MTKHVKLYEKIVNGHKQLEKKVCEAISFSRRPRSHNCVVMSDLSHTVYPVCSRCPLPTLTK
jgi:hypothetical protein